MIAEAARLRRVEAATHEKAVQLVVSLATVAADGVGRRRVVLRVDAGPREARYFVCQKQKKELIIVEAA